MVVLGCAMENVQQERVSSALNYVSELDDSEIIWFVTGGVKNAVFNKETEAKQMEDSIKNTNNNKNNKNNKNKGKIVLDEKAKNTAENFAYLKKWVSQQTFNNDEEPEIVITTSDFHQERAARIFNGIFNDYDPLWNLSSTSSECKHCWNDEKIHMRNVSNDVKNAQYILE